MNALQKLEKNGIILKYEDVVEICQKYHITELSIFGSSIRDDFNEDSDVDILVTFDETKERIPFGTVELIDLFSELLNRDVDIINKKCIKNPIRRDIILSSCEVVYDNT